MAVPTSRDEFKAFCLRKLGAPVINIDVPDIQLDDRIDEALSYFYDFHFDGVDLTYLKYQVKAADVTNRYITLPENILGAIRIFDVSNYLGGGDLFNIRYQIALNDIYTMTSFDMVPYFMSMQHIAEVQQLLGSVQPVRFNRRTNRFYIDTNWDVLPVGSFLVVEAYKIVDPEDYSSVWSDRWLQNYATALIQRQWGDNLSKFVGMTLPGNVQLNGQAIYDKADKQIEKLEEEMRTTWQAPLFFTTG